jgi:hypothetical protein
MIFCGIVGFSGTNSCMPSGSILQNQLMGSGDGNTTLIPLAMKGSVALYHDPE